MTKKPLEKLGQIQMQGRFDSKGYLNIMVKDIILIIKNNIEYYIYNTLYFATNFC